VTPRPSGAVVPVERAEPLLSLAQLLRLTGPLRRVVAAVACRRASAKDAEARAWGMEVIRTRWGGRMYRDPRIAQLAAFRTEHPARAAAGDWPQEWNR